MAYYQKIQLTTCHDKGYNLIAFEGIVPEGGYVRLYKQSYHDFSPILIKDFGYIETYIQWKLSFKDYFCLPGETYEYFLSSTSSGVLNEDIDGKRMVSQPLEESIILSDSERTLYIKYNPKMSSFKSTILEQKIDTIESKYPFFFRNGNVNYKEMPIAGLISYQADEFGAFDERFAAATLNALENRPDDYYLERIFKREVEEWLTNGKPKLLRTLTEGAFVVRLMNVSFSPEDRLGRRIHSFQATAYEIAEANEDNLDKYNLKKEVEE